MLKKIGIYSLILPYFGYIKQWRKLYLTMNHEFSAYWLDHFNEFKEISKRHGLNIKELATYDLKTMFNNKLIYTPENVMIIDWWSYNKELLEKIFDFLIKLEPVFLHKLRFERAIDLSKLA